MSKDDVGVRQDKPLPIYDTPEPTTVPPVAWITEAIETAETKTTEGNLLYTALGALYRTQL